MSPVSFARTTLKILRAPTVADHGAQVHDWSRAAWHDCPGWVIQPGAGSEDLTHRDGDRVDITAYGPVSADVQAGDRVHVPGRGVFVIVGAPARWESPTGRASHTVLALQQWREQTDGAVAD